MIDFKHFLMESTHSHIENHPKTRMREYTSSEFPWEYREYTNYASHVFPKAFKDQNDFTNRYKKAPLKHLTPSEIQSLAYSTASSYLSKDSIKSKIKSAQNEFGYRRDLSRIHNELYKGKMAPPIVLKHSRGLRILGGNTRLSYGLANNRNIPVKLIDISDRY